MSECANDHPTKVDIRQLLEERFCISIPNVFSNKCDNCEDDSFADDSSSGRDQDDDDEDDDDEDDEDELNSMKISGMEILIKSGERRSNGGNFQGKNLLTGRLKRFRSVIIGNRNRKSTEKQQVEMRKNDTISSMHSSSISTATASTHTGPLKPIIIKKLRIGLKR
jgi:hypothetical protein